MLFAFAEATDEKYIIRLINHSDVAGRYGAAAVARAQNAYQVPPFNSITEAVSHVRASLDKPVTVIAPTPEIKPPSIVTLTPEMAQPGLRAISLLEQALRLIDADGGFSGAVRDQMTGLIDAVKAEWSDRPLKLP